MTKARELANFARGLPSQFSSRSAAVAWLAANPALPVGTVVRFISGQIPSNPLRVLSVVFVGTGAVIDDMQGYVPEGDIYADHFAENTVPGTTNMYGALMAGALYAASNGAVLYIEGTYRSNSGLRFNFENARIIGTTERRSRIDIYASAGSDSIWYGPDDPTNPATAIMAGYGFENFTLWRVNSGSTASGFKGVKARSVVLKNVASWGHAWNYSHEACQNVTYETTGSFAVNFNGHTNSAGYRISGLVLSDGSYIEGFTHQLNFGRSDSRNYASPASDVYEATILIEGNDYTLINGLYLGYAQRHVRLKPMHNNARILNTEIADTYLDGVSVPSEAVAIEIDGNGNNGSVDLTRISGGIIAQCKHVLNVIDGRNAGSVDFDGVDMHNFQHNAFKTDSAASSNLRLTINGGQVGGWGRPNGPIGNDLNCFDILRAESVVVQGVRLYGHSTTADRPLGRIQNASLAMFIGCTGTRLSTAMTFTNVTRRVIRDFAANIVIQNVDTGSSGSAPIPTVSADGDTTGSSYNTRSIEWSVGDNGFCTVNMYIVLSAKPTGTGNLRVSLPFAAAVNALLSATLTGGGISTDVSYLSATITAGNSYCLLRGAVTGTGTQKIMQPADITNTTILWISGTYKIA